MASSENQGLQAGLIISVILVIGLGVTTYLFYSQWAAAEADLLARQKELGDRTAAVTTAQGELNTVKRFAGFLDTDAIEKITVDFAKDTDPLLAGRQADAVSYRVLMQELQSTNSEQIKRIADLETENNGLKTTNEQREAAKQGQIDELNKALTAAQDELKKRTEEFTTTANTLAEAKTGLEGQLAASQAAAATAKSEAEKKVAEIQGELERLGGVVQQQTVTIDGMKNESFDIPHGQITFVNQRNRTVWLNLGSEDNLRRQVVFAVYPSDENSVGNDLQRKATIEVTNVLGPHLAEARIRDDEIQDPIISGDKIHTVLWAPGEELHVALAGRMDLNGDGGSDIETLRGLIEGAGAIIDAEVDENGVLKGAITAKTTYLILGSEPRQVGADSTQIDAYTKLRREAIQFGLKTISMEQFLKRSGWSDIRRVLNFVRPGTAAEFLDKGSDINRPKSSGKTSALFRERRPAQEKQAEPAKP
ncbi:MAG: hypothetical protein SGJ19_15645 [Planctomycetia bacterium]|nr:hypothetical protein [Planctomycetia bacterium]